MRVKPIQSLAYLVSYIDEVIFQSSVRGTEGWSTICRAHPSDIADLLEELSGKQRLLVFERLSDEISHKTFQRCTETVQQELLEALSSEQAASVLKSLHSDDLVDLFEILPDERVKHYLKLLQKRQRAQIINLMSFAPKSAAGIVNSDVFTLTNDMTVKRCIQLLQRVSEQKEVRYRTYVIDHDNVLLGNITLDKLVLNKPDTAIADFIEENELVIDAHIDQEEAVKEMTHYGVLSAPVVDTKNRFLGVINSDEVVEVIEEEASEDVYRMSGVGHVERSYFETPILMMFYERSKWLIGLLLLQSVSSVIMKRYDDMLSQHVIISLFLTMLIGTGGNAGNQSATLVIRGLATGEIPNNKQWALFWREFSLGTLIAALLSAVSFLRVWTMHSDWGAALAISTSLFCIVLASMALGTLIPLTLNRLKIDPAHSAAPFLATLMDVIGIVIYCTICSYML
jgi:magnesium transporter